MGKWIVECIYCEIIQKVKAVSRNLVGIDSADGVSSGKFYAGVTKIRSSWSR
jgi:hypothetical protein